MKGLLAAVGFLTVFPVPAFAREATARGRAAPWFPVVGLALGSVVLGASSILAPMFPPLVLGALLATLWTSLTGFLHLDGLADACDGLLASGSRERRLEILRDPRIGAYGAAGLSLALLLKAACLSVASARASPSLLLAPTLARWLAVSLAIFAPARPEGLGREIHSSVRPIGVLIPALLPLLIIAAGGPHSVIAAALALACAAAIGLLARRRLGGMTGDVLGLAIEASEVAVLLVQSVEISP
jgi:adenosylcobinamide-GDP ribazoletransferase